MITINLFDDLTGFALGAMILPVRDANNEQLGPIGTPQRLIRAINTATNEVAYLMLVRKIPQEAKPA